jgi:hypothetical protein
MMSIIFNLSLGLARTPAIEAAGEPAPGPRRLLRGVAASITATACRHHRRRPVDGVIAELTAVATA